MRTEVDKVEYEDGTAVVVRMKKSKVHSVVDVDSDKYISLRESNDGGCTQDLYGATTGACMAEL